MTALATFEPMDQQTARRSVMRVRANLEAAASEIVRQINGRAWLALGYESWDEMREAEYKGAAVIVPRADRPELVARLRSEGLSQKQIGDTVGASQQQVSEDLRNTSSGNTDQPETRTDSLGRQRPTTYTPRARDLPADSPPPVEDSVIPAPSAPDERNTLPPMPPEQREQMEREAARESELRAARTNLNRVLIYLTSQTIGPEQLAKQSFADVIHEFDQTDLDFAASTMTAIAQMRSAV